LLSLSEKLIQRTARSARTSKHKNSDFFAPRGNVAIRRPNCPLYIWCYTLLVQIDIAAPLVQSNVEIRNN
jgi:hypothetical protein